MQATTLTERFADWRNNLDVDAHARLIKNVALAGPNSKNGYRYSESALRAAAPLYLNKPVFLDHAADPARPHARSTRDLVGAIVEPRFEAGRIRSDIRLLDTDSARTFLALVESNAPGVGMSHVVLARRSADGTAVEAIEDVLSVDAVINPATTTTFRESHQPHDSADPSTPRIEEAPTAPPDASLSESADLFPRLQFQLDQLTTSVRNLTQQLTEQPSRAQPSPPPAEHLTSLLSESRLPNYALTPTFLLLLQASPDDEHRRQLIHERLELLRNASRALPSSHPRSPHSPALSNEAFLQAIKGL